jgi:hypothetical protein
MNGKQFFELLARLPARVWVQAILGLIGFVVLAVLGFAVIAGVAAMAVLLIFAFKAKAWVRSLFASRPAPDRNTPKVIDVPYEIVERRESGRRENGRRDDERR